MTAEQHEPPGGHVIVCGLHDVGMRVVEQLHTAGETVIVVDDSPDPRLLRTLDSWGLTYLPASGRRESTLTEAGIDTAGAIVCAAPGDLDNLEIALLARRLRPDLRVVVQLSNQAVGRAVERVTGPGSVLDVASLAAPTFAEACLDVRERPVEIGGEAFVVQELTVDSAGTLRVLFGDIAPIAVIPADGSDMHVCPGRDLAVVPGDRVVVIGTADDLEHRRLNAHSELALPPRRPRRRYLYALTTTWRYARGFASEADRSFRLTLAALLSVAVVSIVLLRVGYHGINGRHMHVLDAVYFTTETLTTVGFGDFYFANQSGWLRIWAIVLMVVGATIVTILYALLTNLLVSRRIAQSLGRQLATRMANHVILVGLGAVGMRVLEALVTAGQQVVVLERDENNRYLADARALDVPVVIGDSTQAANLDAVNLHQARAVAVLTSSDLANIETGLAVDDLLGERRTEVPVVLRVFDRQLAHTIETSFNFRHVRSTAALAAPWFVGAALGLDILHTFYVDQQPMLIGRLTVAESGGLRGQTMLELSARIRVIAIRRAISRLGSEQGTLEYPPRRDTRFEGGDQAYLVGPYAELLQVLRRDHRAI
ncbi:NAD-binding protein [Jatrophihabitans sp.]|uniref:NAD-binding protein n=1 Tax=Jatrophihabitans sp. TaxID=1932789 RepID=UPI0030C680E7|nr:Calcium-gated potassium channel mthK [Jatrophihabitans sp.]